MHGTEFGGLLLRRGWLARIPDDAREAMLQIARIRRFAAGETLFNAGDPPGGIHGVAFGVVAVDHPDHAQQMNLMHLAQPGMWFGQIALLTGETRRVTAVARTDVATMYLPYPQLHALLEAKPVWWRLIALISAETLELSLHGADDLMIRDNDRRCIATLLRLCGCRIEDPDPVVAGSAPVTQDELAAMANMSRNKAGEVLRDLQERDLISIGYRTVTIRNGAALRAIVDGNRLA